MSEFFDSEIVQDELREINDLQQEIYGDLTDFPTLPDEKKKEHILKLTELLERQRVMYTRLSLSEDEEAKALKKQLEMSVVMMGFPEGTDISILFSGMQQTIEKLRQYVD
jgi:hypothetical protein|tara:strand:- start:264 stop:593 length:330 start_codon:yes stop_codon:yes gene_type:complete